MNPQERAQQAWQEWLQERDQLEKGQQFQKFQQLHWKGRSNKKVRKAFKAAVWITVAAAGILCWLFLLKWSLKL